MLISVFKKEFQDRLIKEYPIEEINSFFHLLTEAFLGLSRLDLALDPAREIPATHKRKFEDAMERLSHHEPIQYIIGKTEFFGLPFIVDPNVLIPRPETEELVSWILEDVKKREKKEISILDIGTGSGCIAISLARNLPAATVTAIDVSAAAIEIAKTNAQLNNVAVNFLHQDILTCTNLPHDYDVIVSNPPYVRELEKQEMQRNVLENEPHLALYVKDEDPLIFYRKITKLARSALLPGGVLYFEINQYLGQETKELLNNEGFKAGLKKDIYGNFRMLKGE
ncbi:peptide chain release factor N(5)-glutamine methyltransferase [Antarcticibacterium arcticum]|uniref:Release factor glutamine methyltransferase n=1 Tax=Antarcticibacterium arcticum TaxID=2585771 RepID=A0A5B8YKZ7_9FLAO|nr:peptide chain release factor N(5)-glutamine methyltransferase [Antarcticibacterium arcticum]QED36379.1 peptide chain release factor N(5)-glutamine methyltransferase [Antarcticibacterium arcticum]